MVLSVYLFFLFPSPPSVHPLLERPPASEDSPARLWRQHRGGRGLVGQSARGGGGRRLRRRRHGSGREGRRPVPSLSRRRRGAIFPLSPLGRGVLLAAGGRRGLEALAVGLRQRQAIL